jgi:type IV secretory pathway component VirB8
MEQDMLKKLSELDTKIDAVYKSVEKTRKYFLTIIWVTIALTVLPIIGLIFVLPSFFYKYMGQFQSLQGLGI